VRKHFSDVAGPDADADTIPNANADANPDADADAYTHANTDAYPDAKSGRREPHHRHHTESGAMDGCRSRGV
jgi:hypothetical protein